MTKQTEEAAAAGEKLRYVGVVDVKAGTGAVELRRYKEDHPFAQLSGSDNIISFETKRYTEGQAPRRARTGRRRGGDRGRRLRRRSPRVPVPRRAPVIGTKGEVDGSGGGGRGGGGVARDSL